MSMVWTEAAMLADGAFVGWGAGWLLRARMPRALLACGAAGILLVQGWRLGEFCLTPWLVWGAAACLGAFLAACDALCVSGRPRRLLLCLCVALGLAGADHVVWRCCAEIELRDLGISYRDGVVLQQTGFTCTPASAATCLILLGRPVTEEVLAFEAGTGMRGTAVRRMVPVLRRRLTGTPWRVVRERRSWEGLPRDGTPAMLSTTLSSGVGHSVVFLGFEGDDAVIGDPLNGRVLCARERLEREWSGEGIFFER